MLEDILQDYFNCKKPFKKDGELSVYGVSAYGKLIDLIYQLGFMGVLNESTSTIVDKIDEICDNPIY